MGDIVIRQHRVQSPVGVGVLALLVFISVFLAVPSAEADNEYRQTVDLQEQLGEQSSASTAYGVVDDDIDLFTGDVRLTLPLITLSGRKNLDYSLHVQYSSNVDATKTNAESPTGILGLGWQLGMDSITADTKGTGANTDDVFYLNGQELIPYSAQLPGQQHYYTSRDFSYQRIERFLDSTDPNRIDHWIVTHPDGSKSYYGEMDNARWIVLGDTNHIGVGNEKHYSAWYLSSRKDVFGSAITFQYRKYESSEELVTYGLGPVASTAGYFLIYKPDYYTQTYQMTTAAYTKAMYLERVTDSLGRTVTFSYGLKQSSEYYTPDGVDTTYREKHFHMQQGERLYLSEVSVRDWNDVLLSRHVFGYNQNAQGQTQTLNTGTQLEKRLLTSIQQFDGQGTALNPTTFSYYTNLQLFNNGPLGALQAVHYPNGGVVTYTYAAKQLAYALDQSIVMPGLLQGESQVDYLGNDFLVTKRVSTQRAPAISIFDFKGNTWVHVFNFTVSDFNPATQGLYPEDVMDVSVGKDYVVLLYGDQRTNEMDALKNKMRLFQRNMDDTWEEVTGQQLSLPRDFGTIGDPDMPVHSGIQVQTSPDRFAIVYGASGQKVDIYDRDQSLNWVKTALITSGGDGDPTIRNFHLRDQYLFFLRSYSNSFRPVWYERTEQGGWQQVGCDSDVLSYQSFTSTYAVRSGTQGTACDFAINEGAPGTPVQDMHDFNIVATDEYVAVLTTQREYVRPLVNSFGHVQWRADSDLTHDAILYMWRRQTDGSWVLAINGEYVLERLTGYRSPVGTFRSYYLTGNDHQLFVGIKDMAMPNEPLQRLLRYTPDCINAFCNSWNWSLRDVIDLTGPNMPYVSVYDVVATDDGLLVTYDNAQLDDDTRIEAKLFSRDRWNTGTWDFTDSRFIQTFALFTGSSSHPQPQGQGYEWYKTLASTKAAGDLVSLKAYLPYYRRVNPQLGSVYVVNQLFRMTLQHTGQDWLPQYITADYELIPHENVPPNGYDFSGEYYWTVKDTNQNYGSTFLFQRFYNSSTPVLHLTTAGRVSGMMLDYPLSRKVIDDGFGNQLTYDYQFKNGKYDKHLSSAQYNYAQVSTSYGRTVSRFYNGLDDSDLCEEPCPDMQAFAHPDEMNGLLYQQTDYSTAGDVVQTTANTWTVTERLQRSFEKQLTIATTERDDVTAQTTTSYNEENGEPVVVLIDNGENDVKHCTRYAFQDNPAMNDSHMLTQPSVLATGNRWLNCAGNLATDHNITSLTLLSYDWLDASPPPESPDYLVFLTRTRTSGAITFSGQLAGIASADAICQNEAATAGRGGIYAAWLSTSSVHARDRLPDVRYVLRNGTVVANNKTDLTDTTIRTPIKQYADAGYLTDQDPMAFYVKTGTQANGQTTSYTCNNWLYGGASDYSGTVGNAHSTTSYWTNGGSYYYTMCGSQNPLYCFEVQHTADPDELHPIVLKEVRVLADTIQGRQLITSQRYLNFDDYGNVLESEDGRGTRTRSYYGDNEHPLDNTANGLRHAWPTAVKDALNHTTQATYTTRGLMSSLRDANNVLVQQNVFDGFGRIHAVIKPGDSLENPTIRYDYIEWTPAQPNTVVTTTKLDTARIMTTTAQYDGMGRQILQRQENGNKDVLSRTTYDDSGKVFSTVKPSYDHNPVFSSYAWYSDDPLRRTVLTRTYDQGQYAPGAPTPGMGLTSTTDACVDDDILAEYYCDGAVLRTDTRPCSERFGDTSICQQGRCASYET